MNFEAGTYTIRGLFWNCSINEESKKMDIITKNTIHEQNIKLEEDTDIDKFIFLALKILNNKLGTHLKKEQIYRWFPARPLTWEFQDGVFEICYYHDIRMHNIIYANLYDGIAFEPDPSIKKSLNIFYGCYNLNSDSKEIYSSK